MENSLQNKPLQGISVFLSASIPANLRQSTKSQEIFPAVKYLAEIILKQGGKIIFGGHPTITPLVRLAAKSIHDVEGRLQLHQLRRFRSTMPEEAKDETVFSKIQWSGDESGKADIAEELSEMRELMVIQSQAAIFIGGKTEQSFGNKPGIRDEYERFLKHHPQGPVYLLGLLEGETEKIIKELAQKQNREPNGLIDPEQDCIHHETLIELIAPIIVSDIAKYKL